VPAVEDRVWPTKRLPLIAGAARFTGAALPIAVWSIAE
jgi:hypothetical protein